MKESDFMEKIEILHEDKDIIVCIKPVGISSQENDDGSESMVSLLKEHLSKEQKAPYIAVLHRLDVGVGGVMVYAKTKNAAAKLSAQIADKDLFKKQYLAAVCGKPEEKSGEYTDLLFKDTHLSKSFVVDKERKGVKKATLLYELLEYNEKENLSLVRITLVTGRTHQIRVQFSSRKMPLSGDRKYGAKDGRHKIGLFSHSISFVHPTTGKQLSFSAFPKKDGEVFDNFTTEF